MKLKLYTYSPTHQWDESNAMAVVAESREIADLIFEKTKNRTVEADPNVTYGEPMDVEEHELRNGLMLLPFGYDACDIEAEMFQPCDPK